MAGSLGCVCVNWPFILCLFVALIDCVNWCTVSLEANPTTRSPPVLACSNWPLPLPHELKEMNNGRMSFEQLRDRLTDSMPSPSPNIAGSSVEHDYDGGTCYYTLPALLSFDVESVTRQRLSVGMHDND